MLALRGDRNHIHLGPALPDTANDLRGGLGIGNQKINIGKIAQPVKPLFRELAVVDEGDFCFGLFDVLFLQSVDIRLIGGQAVLCAGTVGAA